jgi:signal transduction histidine kinase
MAVVSAIVLLAFAAGAWIVHRSAASAYREVQRDVKIESGRVADTSGIATALESAYSTGQWQAVRDYASAQAAAHRPFLVLDLQDSVAAASSPDWRKASVRRGAAGGFTVSLKSVAQGSITAQEFTTTAARELKTGDETWGRLVGLPADDAPPQDEGKVFTNQFWQTAAIWLSLVLIGAVAAIGFVVRRALAPISDLTQAARDLQAGKPPAPLARHGASEFRDLLDAYNTAAESIARTERLRRDLISDIAHELRTPLTNLRGQVEALQQGLVPADSDSLSTLQTELRLLERLVGDVHQLAMSDAGQLRVHAQPLPLRETIEQLAAPLVAAAGARMEVSGPGDVWCLADEERMRQVLGNLIENAARHQPQGLLISVGVDRTGDRARFAFQDNGPGIDEGDRPHIFDRFYRAEKSRNRATGGAGLGLAIVQGLLRAMNGSIEYEARPPAGATFVVTLPSAPSPP